MLTYIWLEFPKMDRIMHIVKEFGQIEGGEVHKVFCGQEFFSLPAGPPRPSFGTQEEGFARRGRVCQVCARKMAASIKPYDPAYKVEDMRCPICGEIGKCYWKDVGGGGSYYDQYTFHCSFCSFKKEEGKYGGPTCGGDDFVTQCSFCGKDFDAHKETPRELH